METLNVAIVGGSIAENASISRDFCVFSIITYRMVKTDGVKKRVREDIPVIFWNPGTISEYLTKGKYVVVQGKVASMEEDDGHLVAFNITFPGVQPRRAP